MSVSVQARGGRFQLRVQHRLLPKPFFHTFPTEPEARTYGDQMQALLDAGVVPAELLADVPKGDDPLLVEVIRSYVKSQPVTASDDKLLGVMLAELVGVRVSNVTYAWADAYVRRLKGKRSDGGKPLAPGTIRKRVGVLGRVLDWRIRMTTPAGVVPLANALRLLPDGYSVYSRAEAAVLQAAEQDVPKDVTRDRRFGPGEEARILDALAGQKRDDRERALVVDPAFNMMFLLIVHTGMRLREAYRLRADQVDLKRLVISVDGSKGARGLIKPRQVPIKPVLEPLLREYLAGGRIGRLFPFWDGTEEDLARATARLSARFSVLFRYAKVPDFSEHDLRHEATCRWVEMRSPRGGWAFGDIEICRIMGWTDTRMMLRYASLRGEDLAARMR